MSILGRWEFHSIATYDEENNLVYLTREEYLVSPMPYIDETDVEQVAGEVRERMQTVSMQVHVFEDQTLYFLVPIPEDVSKTELREALDRGDFILYDHMLTDRAIPWEIRDNELYYDMGDGEWVKAIDEDGFFTFFTTRFQKVV